jgi:hypothetical protein
MADGKVLLATAVAKHCDKAHCGAVYHESFWKPLGMKHPSMMWEMQSVFVQPSTGRAFERRMLRIHSLEK